MIKYRTTNRSLRSRRGRCPRTPYHDGESSVSSDQAQCSLTVRTARQACGLGPLRAPFRWGAPGPAGPEPGATEYGHGPALARPAQRHLRALWARFGVPGGRGVGLRAGVKESTCRPSPFYYSPSLFIDVQRLCNAGPAGPFW